MLALAVAIWAASWGFEGSRLREVLVLSGAFRFLGFAGGILGVIDLLRTRKPKPVVAVEAVPENVPGSKGP